MEPHPPSCQICGDVQGEGAAYHCMSNHTICASCTGIQGLTYRLLENYDCRLCQREFLDPEHSKKDVPPLLKRFALLKSAVGVTAAFCGVNKYHEARQVRAKFVCIDCETYSCEKCLSHHGGKNKAIAGHHNICDLVPNRRHDSALCWECSHRKAINFCLSEECNTSLCEVCTSCHDGDHDVKELGVAKKTMEEYIKAKEMTLKHSILYMEEKKLDTERERRGWSMETARIRESINSWADELINVIEKQRCDLLKELRVKEAGIQNEYDVIESNLTEAEMKKGHLKSIHDLLGDVSNISDVTSAYGFLKANEATWRSSDVRGLTEAEDNVHFKEIIYRRHKDIMQNLRHNNLVGQIHTLIGYKSEPMLTSSVQCETDTEPAQIANIIIPKPNRLVVCDRGNKAVKSSRLISANGKHNLREFHMKSQHISQLVHDKKRGRLLGGVCNSWYSWFDEVWVLSWDLFNEKQLCRVGEHHAGLLLVINDNFAYVITAFHTEGARELTDSCEDLRTYLHGSPHGETSPKSSLSRVQRRGDQSPKPPSSPKPSASGYTSPNIPSSPRLSKSAELVPAMLSRKLRRYQLFGVPETNSGPSTPQLSPRLGNSPLLARRKRCITCPTEILNFELHGRDEKELDSLLADVTKRKWKGEIFVYDLDTFEQISNVTTDYCPQTAVATPTGELVMISRDGWMRVLTSSLQELRSVQIAGIRGHREADFHAQTASALAVNGRGQLIIGLQGRNAITEKKGGRINLYSLSGEFLRTLINEESGLHRPSAASIDDHGKLYIADDNQDGGQSLVVFLPERERSANHGKEENGLEDQAAPHELTLKGLPKIEEIL